MRASCQKDESVFGRRSTRNASQQEFLWSRGISTEFFVALISYQNAMTLCDLLVANRLSVYNTCENVSYMLGPQDRRVCRAICYTRIKRYRRAQLGDMQGEVQSAAPHFPCRVSLVSKILFGAFHGAFQLKSIGSWPAFFLLLVWYREAIKTLHNNFQIFSKITLLTIMNSMWIAIPILLPHRFNKASPVKKYAAWLRFPHSGTFQTVLCNGKAITRFYFAGLLICIFPSFYAIKYRQKKLLYSKPLNNLSFEYNFSVR